MGFISQANYEELTLAAWSMALKRQGCYTGTATACCDQLVMPAMDMNWKGGIHATLDRLSQTGLF